MMGALALRFRSVPERFVTRGFVGRREPASSAQAGRIPPGQHVVKDFPVLSAGPTPRTPLASWSFKIEGVVKEPASWSWADFQKLPAQDFVKDISCVTKWTKLDTRWRGVSVDTLLEQVELDPRSVALVASCDGGYTTNLLLSDALNGQGFVAYEYDGTPLAPEPGGPARPLAPPPTATRRSAATRSARHRSAPARWTSRSSASPTARSRPTSTTSSPSAMPSRCAVRSAAISCGTPRVAGHCFWSREDRASCRSW